MKRMGELAGTADWQKKRGGEKPPRSDELPAILKSKQAVNPAAFRTGV